MYIRLLGLCLISLCPAVAHSGGQPDVEHGEIHTRLSMTELFRLGADDSPESVFFGTVGGLAVNSKGRIFVGDYQAHTVYVFSDTGRLVTSIGREGEGPGEFNNVNGVFVGQADTVFVVHDRTSQLSVFEPDTYEFDHSVRIGHTDRGYPTQFLGVNANRYVFVYRSFVNSRADLYEPLDSLRVMLVERNGKVEGQIVSVIEDSDIHFTIRDGTVFVSKTPVPFARRSYFRLGTNGQVYTGRTDSIRISIADLSGKRVRYIQRPHRPEPVTRAEIDERTAHIIDNEARREFAAAIPRTKPAFRTFRVDEKGQIWLKTTGGQDDTATWTILSAEGALVGEVILPVEASLRVIDDGRAYAVTEDEAGAPIVVVYRIGDAP